MPKQPKSTVLIIEPDKVLADAYQRTLRSAGITATICHNAQDAISSVDALHPQVIVLEVQLPHHNGIEFLYELRSYADLQTIPVILHTFVPETELGLTSQLRTQLNIQTYLYKPRTSLATLSQAITEVLAS